jgi:hypothetical protein
MDLSLYNNCKAVQFGDSATCGGTNRLSCSLFVLVSCLAAVRAQKPLKIFLCYMRLTRRECPCSRAVRKFNCRPGLGINLGCLVYN